MIGPIQMCTYSQRLASAGVTRLLLVLLSLLLLLLLLLFVLSLLVALLLLLLLLLFFLLLLVVLWLAFLNNGHTNIKQPTSYPVSSWQGRAWATHGDTKKENDDNDKHNNTNNNKHQAWKR